MITLVQRTPYLLAYEIEWIGADGPPELIRIPNAQLVEDARAWRDRGIHRLVTTPVIDEDAARLLFEGVGLTTHPTVNVTRGRLSLRPLSAAPWGCRAGFDAQAQRALIEVLSPPSSARAVVTLELEKSR